MNPDTVPLARLDELWDFGDPAESERRFEALLPRARSEHEGAYLAEALTQLARARGLQRRFDDARRTLAEAEAALRPENARGRVRLLLETGRVARSANEDGLGRDAFLAAWELARTAGEDALSVDAAHMLGIVEPAEEGWTWNERAMEVARSSDDPAARRWVGSLANNMGWARHDEGAYGEALELFALSREAFQAEGRDDRARIARWSIARCRRSRGDIEEALAEQRVLLAELDALGETDGYVLEEIAECLLALGQEEEARPFLARAYDALSADTHLGEDEPDRLERLRALAGT